MPLDPTALHPVQGPDAAAMPTSPRGQWSPRPHELCSMAGSEGHPQGRPRSSKNVNLYIFLPSL